MLGVVSDAQESIRLAVAEVFPGVPHQLCQWHALREAAEPLWEADRHLLVEAKQELRPLREVEERTRGRDPEGADPASGVVLDAVLALRQTVRERGGLPFDFAALRVLDRLEAVGQTLDRCLAKGGTRAWPGSGCWWGAPWSAAGPGRATCAGCTAGCSTWPTPWSRTTPRWASRPGSGATVRQQVELILGHLRIRCLAGGVPAWLRPKVEYLVTVLRRLGPGLYHCYDVPGLPRTDNAMEQFYRRVKSEQRRITGRKRADAFVVRVGGFAVYATGGQHRPRGRAAPAPGGRARGRLAAGAGHPARQPGPPDEDAPLPAGPRRLPRRPGGPLGRHRPPALMRVLPRLFSPLDEELGLLPGALRPRPWPRASCAWAPGCRSPGAARARWASSRAPPSPRRRSGA